MLEICIIDDEPLALQYLGFLLNQVDGVNIAGAYSDPTDLIHHLNTAQVDAVLMDIQMPGVLGIDLAEDLQKIQPELDIVFVTAYEEYAIKAFELHALDYILKPIEKKRLESTIKRIKAEIAEKSKLHTEKTDVVINNLGHLEILKNGKLIETKWRTTRAKELFSYFIQDHQHLFRKNDLINKMWPNIPWDNANAQLYSSVYQIRRLLKGTKIPISISSQDEYYHVSRSEVKLLSTEWKRDVLKNLDADRPSVHNLMELLKAYRGDYFEGIKQDWVIPEREALRELWFQLIQVLIPLVKNKEERSLPLIVKLKSLVSFDREAHDLVEELTAQ